ncbi:MAG: hypothetical protein GY750_04080 [Lentisphaerae bacterium]|nr:hypothetical protein [Lentisphaerota bacterium]MCP4100592.1 hypothetical protein [Lentisphaerota bacterium]
MADARRDFCRNNRLYKRKVYSEKQYCDAENEYLQALNDFEVAKLEVEEAREALDNLALRAPFKGVIEEVFYAAGSTLESAVPVLRISVLSPVRVQVHLPEALTRELSVNDNFKVYPAGGVTPHGAWLDSRGIFSDRIELVASNITIPLGNLTEEQSKMPKVTGLEICSSIEKHNQYPLWVPAESLVKEGNNWYVWTAAGQMACTIDKPIAKQFIVKKIKVNPADVVTEHFTEKYRALKDSNGMHPCQVVVLRSSKKLIDGKLAVVQIITCTLDMQHLSISP